MTTNQEGKHASFRTLGSGTGDYNGDAIAAMLAEGATGSSFNEIMVSWLQIRTSSSKTNLNDLQATFAAQLGFDSWDSVNVISSSQADWADYTAANDKSPVEFSSSAVRYCELAPIDSTRALLVYRGTSSFCRARICTVDANGDVTFGTEAVILSAIITDAAVDVLDETHAIIAVETGSIVKTIAIEFSGTTISAVGTAVTVASENSTANTVDIAAISPTEYLVIYGLSGTGGRCGYGSVSGTTITAGNVITYETILVFHNTITKLASGTAIIAAGHDSAMDGEVYLMSVSGTTPQVDDQATFEDGSGFTVTETDCIRIDDNNVLVVWTEATSQFDCRAVVVTESSGTLSVGTEVVFSSSVAEYMSIALPNSTQAVVTIGINSVQVQTTVIEISGTSLTALTNRQNATTDKEYVTNIQVGTDTVLIAYEDDNDASKGKVISARVA